MLHVDVEQCVNVKFCVQLGKPITEMYYSLKVYGDDCLSRTQVFEWFKRFKEGREEEIRDDQHPSHSSTSKTDANIEKAGEIFRQNCRLSIQAVAELINTNKETVRQILHNNFNTVKKSVSEDGAENPHS